MRSRYSAYLVRNVDYLLKTWHPSTRPTAIDPATIPDWQELNVIRTENGKETDAEGIVEFVATAIAHNGILRLHEVSRFVREGGQWLYLDGEIKEDSPPAVSKKSKAGRNDPCPCGSGKKFKKCCGA